MKGTLRLARERKPRKENHTNSHSNSDFLKLTVSRSINSFPRLSNFICVTIYHLSTYLTTFVVAAAVVQLLSHV